MTLPVSPPVSVERIEVFGVVQGVGFRPFVYRLATELALSGRVGNDSGKVFIEVAGPQWSIEKLIERLQQDPPPLAKIDRLRRCGLDDLPTGGFVIVESESAVGERTQVPPDTALCADCRRELIDPNDRRFGHPFITCTNCGPRFTIIEDLPYDRPSTTMAGFELCPACSTEYHDPSDRRYHAQPIGCLECGPRLSYVSVADSGAAKESKADPIEAARRDLADGRIVAIKGLGGFRLACDAANDEAVSRLRGLKHRPDKSFAVMVADLEGAERLAVLSQRERDSLVSAQAPIVLACSRNDSTLSSLVAPGNPLVGIMLAHTAVDHLLFDGFEGALVMTSANLSGEPICYEDCEIADRVAPLCDSILTNDRSIVTSCDDSVVRLVGDTVLPIRRARGYAPIPVALAGERIPVLAVGGELKNAFCLASTDHAWISQHLGDTENLSTIREFEASVERFMGMYEVSPEVLVADAHPGYHTARWAERSDLAPVVKVQHHHAHLGSVMAENGMDPASQVIGFAFDGTGYGDDGAIWGGEVMVADGFGYERVGHLSYVPLPGGDQAARQPFRSALSHMRSAGVDWDDSLAPVGALETVELDLLSAQLERGFACTDTSSMGRLFDAVASLVGLRNEISFEAQAAIDLEMAAAGSRSPRRYAFGWDGVVMDPGPVVRSIADDLRVSTDLADIALGFHGAVATMVTGVAETIRDDRGLETVALSGGVFQNALLTSMCCEGLSRAGFSVLTNRLVPPNDGGLSLGQAYIGGWSCLANDLSTAQPKKEVA